jgi:hypothetical protein
MNSSWSTDHFSVQSSNANTHGTNVIDAVSSASALYRGLSSRRLCSPGAQDIHNPLDGPVLVKYEEAVRYGIILWRATMIAVSDVRCA